MTLDKPAQSSWIRQMLSGEILAYRVPITSLPLSKSHDPSLRINFHIYSVTESNEMLSDLHFGLKFDYLI
jgi:hypothetical protein